MKKKSRKKLWIYDSKWLKFGSISRVKCEYCNNNLLYFDKYDALCCPRCNLWNEAKCNDPTCDYCKIRPETPDIGLFYEEINTYAHKQYYIKKYNHRLKRLNHRNNIKEIRNESKIK